MPLIDRNIDLIVIEPNCVICADFQFILSMNCMIIVTRQ